MNEYVDMALEILNDSSEHDSTGKFISHFNLNNRETIVFFFALPSVIGWYGFSYKNR